MDFSTVKLVYYISSILSVELFVYDTFTRSIVCYILTQYFTLKHKITTIKPKYNDKGCRNIMYWFT